MYKLFDAICLLNLSFVMLLCRQDSLAVLIYHSFIFYFRFRGQLTGVCLLATTFCSVFTVAQTNVICVY